MTERDLENVSELRYSDILLLEIEKQHLQMSMVAWINDIHSKPFSKPFVSLSFAFPNFISRWLNTEKRKGKKHLPLFKNS